MCTYTVFRQGNAMVAKLTALLIMVCFPAWSAAGAAEPLPLMRWDLHPAYGTAQFPVPDPDGRETLYVDRSAAGDAIGTLKVIVQLRGSYHEHPDVDWEELVSLQVAAGDQAAGGGAPEGVLSLRLPVVGYYNESDEDDAITSLSYEVALPKDVVEGPYVVTLRLDVSGAPVEVGDVTVVRETSFVVEEVHDEMSRLNYLEQRSGWWQWGKFDPQMDLYDRRDRERVEELFAQAQEKWFEVVDEILDMVPDDVYYIHQRSQFRLAQGQISSGLQDLRTVMEKLRGSAEIRLLPHLPSRGEMTREHVAASIEAAIDHLSKGQ